MFIGHYNINSVRNKFYDIFPLFVKYDIDIIGVAETKLDNSFASMQFGVANYKLYRQDRNSKGGGVMLYVKDSIPHRLLKEHSGVYMGIDYLTVEISVKSIKWNLVYIYRPPSVKVKVFCEFLSSMCEIFVNFFGDMSCNPSNSTDLCDVCGVFGFKNIIKALLVSKLTSPL